MPQALEAETSLEWVLKCAADLERNKARRCHCGNCVLFHHRNKGEWGLSDLAERGQAWASESHLYHHQLWDFELGSQPLCIQLLHLIPT